MHRHRYIIAAWLALFCGCSASSSQPLSPVPDWAADIIWYRLVPDRFRSGDPTNDPRRSDLPDPGRVPTDWAVSDWTADWHFRAAWERRMDPDPGRTAGYRRYGGDLQGMLDRLEYLAELGVNGLVLSGLLAESPLSGPSAAPSGSTGPAPGGGEIHHVDPRLGPDPERDYAQMATESSDPATWRTTAADSLFLEFLSRAHARGIRVVLSVDPGASARVPAAYFSAATLRWMDPNGDGDPADGIDGWEIKAGGGFAVGFWADWNAGIRALNSEALTVGWVDGPVPATGFSVVPDRAAFSTAVAGFLLEEELSASQFVRLLKEARQTPSEAVGRALPNRIPAQRTDRDLLRLGALFQMTWVGAPELDYGTETGMWFAGDSDPGQPMLWYDLTYADRVGSPSDPANSPVRYRFDPDLHLYYRQAIGLRRSHPSLRRGRSEVVQIDDAAQTMAFVRDLEEEVLLVVVNRSEQTRLVSLDRLVLEIGEGEGLYPIFSSGGAVDATQIAMEGDRTLIIPVPARSGLVLIRTGVE
jgi:hypothetical protein